MASADRDGDLAARCWLAAHGVDPDTASPLALVGAAREVRYQAMITGFLGGLGGGS